MQFPWGKDLRDKGTYENAKIQITVSIPILPHCKAERILGLFTAI